MPKYFMGDEMCIARGAADLVSKMRETAFLPSASVEEYMAEVAKRVYKTSGDEVSVKTPQAFVADLLACGQLRQEA